MMKRGMSFLGIKWDMKKPGFKKFQTERKGNATRCWADGEDEEGKTIARGAQRGLVQFFGDKRADQDRRSPTDCGNSLLMDE